MLQRHISITDMELNMHVAYHKIVKNV